jgi:hypothetical protein
MPYAIERSLRRTSARCRLSRRSPLRWAQTVRSADLFGHEPTSVSVSIRASWPPSIPAPAFRHWWATRHSTTGGASALHGKAPVGARRPNRTGSGLSMCAPVGATDSRSRPPPQLSSSPEVPRRTWAQRTRGPQVRRPSTTALSANRPDQTAPSCRRQSFDT